jgi:nicotinate phosphoribosyltransferase
MKDINHGLLDTDYYKLTMMQAILHQFPTFTSGWKMIDRKKHTYSDRYFNEFSYRMKYLCDNIHLTKDESVYLRSNRVMKPDFVDWLEDFRLRYDDLSITKDDNGLSVEVKPDTPWVRASIYEILALSTQSELMTLQDHTEEEIMQGAKERLNAKIARLENGLEIGAFSEFGTRRRASYDVQKMVIEGLAKAKFPNAKFVGTSNVHLAMEMGLTPVGTMAHEWIMGAGQGNVDLYNPAAANRIAAEAWRREYGLDNGTFLTDCITTDMCMLDFDEDMAKAFSGVRHDSGDPIEWGEKWLEFYNAFHEKRPTDVGLDPLYKTLLFSDSLDFDRAAAIYSHFKGRCRVAFGIGTYLANDTGFETQNVVMKMTTCNGNPVAKIADPDPIRDANGNIIDHEEASGKGICKDEEYINFLKKSIEWRKAHNTPKVPYIIPVK